MKDLSNQRFGRLIAIEVVGKNKHGNMLWSCRCDCGKEHTASSGKLVQGKVTSCGCYFRDINVERLETHGLTTGGKPRLFTIWLGMRSRCFNPKSVSYKNYGDRGISVCEEWLNFEIFHNWAIEHGYSNDLQIDRIDNNGNYNPENCRWVTKAFNLSHQRRNRYITIQDEIKTISQWIVLLNLSRSTVYAWLKNGEDFLLKKLTQKYQEQSA